MKLDELIKYYVILSFILNVMTPEREETNLVLKLLKDKGKNQLKAVILFVLF
jgi:hypothetical protein